MPLQTEIKIAVAQMEVSPGDPEKNVEKIIGLIREAVKRGDELIVFPEMCVSGYLLGDEWENEAFVKDLYNYNEAIIEASRDIAVVWGNVDIDEQKINEDGRVRQGSLARLELSVAGLLAVWDRPKRRRACRAIPARAARACSCAGRW